MNVIKSLIARIEDYRKTNKNPCKNYATEEAAEKATQAMAATVGKYFDTREVEARYVVFLVPEWNRWVGAIDLTEVVNRSTSRGGYLGIAKNFFTY